ncbi:two-component regulator propeller domain-containing protein [Maribacter chungangensis]|uniref:histidine kinase n=1 Tax=Maribacter chungangensis TaxID=1069117 RepID=A0ABW3AZ33_9FLAO
MPQNSATVLFEDSYGFIWVGTPNGLNKYNGTNFELFENSSNIYTNRYITSLYESQSNLYIGTNQGLSLYDRDLNLIQPFDFKPEGAKLNTRNIRAIAKVDSLLWLGTFSNGLYKYNTNTGETNQFLVSEKLVIDNKTDNLIIKIVPLSGKRLLVIASSKIFILDYDLQILKTISSDEFLNVAVNVDAQNFLIGTGQGSLIKLTVHPDGSLETKHKKIAPNYPVLSLARDRDEAIWIGTENNGLYRYNESTETLDHFKTDIASPNSIPNNSIWALLNTKNNVMWLAPYKKGLSFYDPEYYKFKKITQKPWIDNTINNGIINCFNEDNKGNLWIGTDGGGLNYWDRSTDTFTYFSLNESNFPSNVILTLLKVDVDELWVGTWANGMVVFNTKNKTYETWDTTNSFLLSNNISDLMRDHKGRIWIVNLFGGLQVYDPKTGHYEKITLISDVDNAEINTVYKVAEDAQGNIWIGTQTSGILKLTESEKGWSTTHYHSISASRKLSNDFVNVILQDAESNVWAGTNAGLDKYDLENDTFVSRFVETEKATAVKAIIEGTQDALWLSSDNGIYKYIKQNDSIVHYVENDGLQANEFNASSSFKTATGEFVFGGINGFNLFDPDNIKKRTDVPELVISGLNIFNEPVLANDDFDVLDKDISRLDSIQFNYDHSVINFNFNALTFRHSKAVNYAYFLEGFETDWNYVGTNANATYTNLNPGSYTFRVKSTNSDGIWVPNEKQLFIVVQPPYWQTTWFRLLVLTLIILSISLAYHIKMRSIQKRQQELETLIEERTKELQYQKDKLAEVADELSVKNEEIQRFTFAVTHDLKGPLNNIKSIATLIPNEVAGASSSNLKKYLGLIDVCYDIMNKLITDISLIAKLGKIENNYEVLDANEIIALAQKMNSENLEMGQVTLQVDDSLPKIYGDRNRMIQVFGNFLDNAVKYMGNQPQPHIRVHSHSHGEYVTFLVEDNGSGMNTDALKRLFTPFERFHSSVKGTGLGLYMVRQIAVAHGGQITATSQGEGKGTTFRLVLPKVHIAKERVSKNEGFREI